MFKERSWERPEFGEVESARAGVRKWLLLYRPEGIGGWITHFLFYFCAHSALVLKVGGVLAAAGALHDSSRWLALICFSSASFVRMASVLFERSFAKAYRCREALQKTRFAVIWVGEELPSARAAKAV